MKHAGVHSVPGGQVSREADLVNNDLSGWTLRTPDGSLCAQFEHTVAITQGRLIIITPV